MQVKEETLLKTRYSLIVIVLSFIIMYPLWMIGDRELYWNEGLYAVEASGMEYWLPVSRAHGIMQTTSFPLFPWLTRIMHDLSGWPIAFCMRSIVITTLGCLIFLVWHTTRRVASTTGATVAAAVMMSTSIIFEKSLDGYPEMLGLLFLTIAWLLWFYIGTIKNNWSLAWVAGYFFCGLAFYSIGWKAIIIFTVPLIFMRRPLTVWTKIRKTGFFAGIALLAGFIMLWFMPYLQSDQPLSFLILPSTSWSEYLLYLLTFPFEVLIRFLPWSIIIWAPFCVALIPLDKTPVFSRFLRTIAYSLFFLIWLSPSADSRNLIFLAPPVAILSGTYYWIVARRYEKQFRKTVKFCSVLPVTVAIAIISVYFLPSSWWTQLFSVSRGMNFVTVTKYQLICLLYGGLLCGIGIWLYTRAAKVRAWELILLISLCLTSFFWVVMNPYRAQNRGKSILGHEIKQVLREQGAPSDTLIYKSNIVDLYGECYYSGYRVERIISLNDISEAEPVVYLLSMSFPSIPERRWSNLFPANKMYRGKRLCLWKGELIKRYQRELK